MTRCSSCSTKKTDDTVFCKQCGRQLMQGAVNQSDAQKSLLVGQ